MAILPLKLYHNHFMSLAIEVRVGRKTLLGNALPFLVDTAAQRTFISLQWKKRILEAARKQGVSERDLDIKLAQKPARYLCGKLLCENIYALKLVAEGIGSSKVTLKGKEPGVSVLLEEQNGTKISPPNVNVIGMDILQNWMLVREPYPSRITPTNYPMFFLTDDGGIKREFRKAEGLRPFFKRFRQLPPEEISDIGDL